MRAFATGLVAERLQGLSPVPGRSASSLGAAGEPLERSYVSAHV